MKSYIEKITRGENLTIDEAEDLMEQILTDATDSQIAAVLIGLKMKGESPSEIAGLAMGMKKKASSITPKISTLIDTCGTGGDNSHTINISTIAAILVASSGVCVAKHGNYSITSKCGSADILKASGVKIDLEPPEVCRMIEEVGMGFMLAPIFHPSMKRVAPIRREIGVRTVFNILGPLTNPANVKRQVIGVFDPSLCLRMAEVLRELGSTHAIVVHGSGLDEITTTGPTEIVELKNGNIESFTITPEDYGLERAKLKDLEGRDAEYNVKVMLEILNGKKGFMRDIVALNAAAGLYIGQKACDIKEGLEIANNLLDEGRGIDKLDEMVAFR
ncbi:MAG: anthranilate phosphoribosyltransferase [Candidatus Syntropharchaeales archaeon]